MLEESATQQIVKFVDIILDLYSPVPSELRNQMRLLQSTLIHGKVKQLHQHIQELQNKLDLRIKFQSKQNIHNFHNVQKKQLQNGSSYATAQSKSSRDTLNYNQQDKQNKNTINTSRLSTCDSFKKVHAVLTECGQQKVRKLSSMASQEKSFDGEFYGIKRENSESGRISHRGLLKVVKKNNSTRDNSLSNNKSFSDCFAKKSSQFKKQILQISQILSENDNQLAPYLRELQKQCQI